ncbi:GNAT family N-acetyltransferase [Embleya sp. NPDC020630]|uniref:GNAT family N-acetyltransferase n=1 Tax=Embleya sp. NPDC020630 TaxID=3363979 RepID=UPI0037B71383
MPESKRPDADHASAVLSFEVANRDYFAASVSDRGDEYYDRFADRHAALLVEQEAGLRLLRTRRRGWLDPGPVHLYDLKDGSADIGYRVARHATGRGVATAAVLGLCGLARTRYGLRTLRAAVALANTGTGLPR